MPFKVNRCVCSQLTFPDLDQIARENKVTTLPDLCAITGCGTHCGLCKPYISVMLETGKVEFELDYKLPDISKTGKL